MYPAGATTNSANGVTNIEGASVQLALRTMEELDLVLLIHGEVTTNEADMFDRERLFVQQRLPLLRSTFPKLRIVLEHVSTMEAVEYVRNAAGSTLAATITAHHLLYSRNAMLVGGARPHFFCLPVLKREQHRQALLEAATSDRDIASGRFFAGTDSAPHPRQAKEGSCCAAGCFTSHAALVIFVLQN